MTATESQTLPEATSRQKHFPKRRRSLMVFISCVIISTLMWLFIELMKDYTDEIQYSVVFENVPGDLILLNNGDSLLTAGVSAQGFELLAAKYLNAHRQLKIDLTGLRIRQTAEGYSAFMPSSAINEQISRQLRFSKSISYIKPDTLFFAFSEIFRKEVPVRLDISYSVGNQFDIVDTIDYSPRKLLVSSIKSVIDTLEFVKTMPVSLQNIDSSVVLTVPLAKGRNAGLLRYAADSVSLKLNVQRVTEAVYYVPVAIKTSGENIRIFPDKVELQCRVPLSEYPHIETGAFTVQVDFDRATALKSKKLKVAVVNVPKSVKLMKVKPEEVEYIIISP